MIGNKHRRPRPQILAALNDDKLHAHGQLHNPLEASPRRPLADLPVTHESEYDACKDAIAGADEQEQEGCDEAGVEA